MQWSEDEDLFVTLCDGTVQSYSIHGANGAEDALQQSIVNFFQSENVGKQKIMSSGSKYCRIATKA